MRKRRHNTRAKRAAALLLSLAVMTLGCGALTGCGEEKKQTETLRLCGILGEGERHDIYASALTDFSTLHPELYLRDISTSEDDAFKLEVNLASTYTKSDSPHIIYYYNNADMQSLAEYFVSIEEIRGEYPDFLSSIGQNALDSVQWQDGGTDCIPVMGDWCAIAVNKRLLGQYGLDVPEDWGDLLKTIDTLSAAGVIPFADSAENSGIYLEQLIRAEGSQAALKIGLNGESSVLNSIWLRAAKVYKQLCERNAFAPSAYSPSLVEYVSEPTMYDKTLGERDKTIKLDPVKLFNDGKAAMIAVDRETWLRIEDTSDVDLTYLPDHTKYTENTTSGSDVSAEETPVVHTLGFGTSPSDIAADAFVPEKVYGGFTEGFYITRKAYSDPNLRGLIIELMESFESASAAEKLSALGYLTPNTSVGAAVPQLSGVEKAASDGKTYLPTMRNNEYAARWSYIEQCTAQLWYGVLEPEPMMRLLGEESMNAVDVLELMKKTASDSDAMFEAAQ